MASALFAALKENLTFDGPDIDTWVYKFYSRVTVGLFLVAGAASVFSDIVEQYCSIIVTLPNYKEIKSIVS